MGDARNCFGHTSSINSVHFQQDANFVWTASSDKSARSFRVSSGGANKTLQSHSKGLSCLQCSDDGSLVLTGGLDCAAVVTRTQQASNQAPLHILAHDAALTSVGFIPGGGGMITCSNDGCVMLWRLEALEKLPRLKNYDLQSQMFEDEHAEYQALLKDHKDLCLRCCTGISFAKDLLHWHNPTPKKSAKVPSFNVSASAHDSVCPPWPHAGNPAAGGIQRLKFFRSRSGLACAIGRAGVAMLQIDEAL
jgi:WD40 repeat protein